MIAIPTTFPIGSKVRVLVGIYAGVVGVVKCCNPTHEWPIKLWHFERDHITPNHVKMPWREEWYKTKKLGYIDD